jgi:hypothetical protein
VQAYDAELAALAGLTSAADKGIQFTGSGTAAVYTLTTFAKTILDDVDAAAVRSTLGVDASGSPTIADGTITLAKLADLAQDQFIGRTTASTGVPQTATITAAARTVLDDTTVGNMLTTLGGQPLDAELTALAGLTSAADKLPYFTGSGTAALADLTTFGRSLIDDAAASNARTTLGVNAAGKEPREFCFALSDETTAITTGTDKLKWRVPFACTLTAVRASLSTVSSSGIPTVDINESGTTVLSTKLTIDASESTSTTAANAAVISDSALADDARSRSTSTWRAPGPRGSRSRST